MIETFQILLAEDDADDRFFFTEAFSGRKEITVAVVENGVDLLDHLAELKATLQFPHLIVLDQNMPKLSGLETLRELKIDTHYAQIPVILYSTYADDRLRELGRTDGALLVLDKPIDRNGYINMLNTIRIAIGNVKTIG